MIEFVNIADHQDESAGLPSIEIFVLQKIQRQHFGPQDFCLGRPFITLFFLKYRNQGSNLRISGSQLDSSSSWHRGNV